MKISEIIAEVNERSPNAFSEETKGKILCNLESQLIHEFKGEEVKVKYPEDLQKELVLPDRYADVYILYLSAMMYFWNKEYEEYNNHVGFYNELLEQYREEHGSKARSERKRFFNLF